MRRFAHAAPFVASILGGNGAVREAFALIDGLPVRVYFKLGKFIPPY